VNVVITPGIPVGGTLRLSGVRGLLCCFDSNVTGDTSYLTIVRTTHFNPPAIYKGSAAEYSIKKDASGVYIQNDSTRDLSVAYCLLKF
jgi:hypothetical protein